jgi:hypothetical protein
VLSERAVFGDLAGDAVFAAQVERDLVAITQRGARAALAARLAQDRSLAA